MTQDLWRLDATTLAARIRRREIIAREAVQAVLYRIADVNPRIKALAEVTAATALAAVKTWCCAWANSFKWQPATQCCLNCPRRQRLGADRQAAHSQAEPLPEPLRWSLSVSKLSVGVGPVPSGSTLTTLSVSASSLKLSGWLRCALRCASSRSCRCWSGGLFMAASFSFSERR